MKNTKKLCMIAVVLLLAALPAVGLDSPARPAVSFLSGGGDNGTAPSTGTDPRICIAVVCPIGYVMDANCKCVPVMTQLASLSAPPSTGTAPRGCVAMVCPPGYYQAPDCQCRRLPVDLTISSPA